MFETASRYQNVNGLRMHYRVRGPKDAPPLLLLHGIMGNAWEWDTAIDRLTERFRVFAPDQRGHGRTGWEPPFTAPRMGADAAGLVQALDLWNVTLVGHSMGGLAGAFAVADHPRRFGRLAVLDIGPTSLGSAAVARLVPALRHFARATYANPRAATDEWLAGDPYARRDLMRHYVEHGLVRDRDGLYRWRYDAQGLQQFVLEGADAGAVSDALRRVCVPTLIVRGENSNALTAAGAAEMMELLTQSDLRVIPGAAHDLGVQQPEAVAAAILEFASGSGGRERLDSGVVKETKAAGPKAGYLVLGDRRVVLL